MNDKSNGALVFLGLILVLMGFGLGRVTASTPEHLTISHRINWPTFSGEAKGGSRYDTERESGFVIKLVNTQ